MGAKTHIGVIIKQQICEVFIFELASPFSSPLLVLTWNERFAHTFDRNEQSFYYRFTQNIPRNFHPMLLVNIGENIPLDFWWIVKNHFFDQLVLDKSSCTLAPCSLKILSCLHFFPPWYYLFKKSLHTSLPTNRKKLSNSCLCEVVCLLPSQNSISLCHSFCETTAHTFSRHLKWIRWCKENQLSLQSIHNIVRRWLEV